MKKGIDTKENILAVPYKVEHTVTLHPEMLSTVSMSIYSNEIKHVCTKTCWQMYIATSFAKNYKLPTNPSSGEWLIRLC